MVYNYKEENETLLGYPNSANTRSIFRVKQNGLKYVSSNILSIIRRWANNLKKSMQMEEDNLNSDLNPGVVHNAIGSVVNSVVNSAMKRKFDDFITWNSYEGLISTQSMMKSEKVVYYFIFIFLFLLMASTTIRLSMAIFTRAPIVIFVVGVLFLSSSVIHLYPSSRRTWWPTDGHLHSKFAIPTFRYSHLYTLHITTSAFSLIIFLLLQFFSHLESWYDTFTYLDITSGVVLGIHAFLFGVRAERNDPDKVQIYQYAKSKSWVSKRALKHLKAAAVETISLSSVSVHSSDPTTPPNGSQQFVIETPPSETSQEQNVGVFSGHNQEHNEDAPSSAQQESYDEPSPHDGQEINGS